MAHTHEHQKKCVIELCQLCCRRSKNQKQKDLRIKPFLCSASFQNEREERQYGSEVFSSFSVHSVYKHCAMYIVCKNTDDRGNDGINYLSLSLPPCLSHFVFYSGNKPTETDSESKRTHASDTLAGACEAIN